MRARQLLLQGKDTLETAGVEDAHLDALVLLAEAMGLTTARVMADADEATPEQGAAFGRLLARRAGGEPVAYILGRKEFFSLDFLVDKRVLIPRPDTETLVEAALGLARGKASIRRLHDACTGSGCVAVSLAHELGPGYEVSASDLSAAALQVFVENSRRLLGRELPFWQSDLLSSVPGGFDLIVSNPPYIPSGITASMMEAGWPEPAIALDGGDQGLAPAARLISQALDSLAANGYLLLEAADDQAEALEGLFQAAGYRAISVFKDLAGRRRVTAGQRP